MYCSILAYIQHTSSKLVKCDYSLLGMICYVATREAAYLHTNVVWRLCVCVWGGGFSGSLQSVKLIQES
jgi:hypothetical protein